MEKTLKFIIWLLNLNPFVKTFNLFVKQNFFEKSTFSRKLKKKKPPNSTFLWKNEFPLRTQALWCSHAPGSSLSNSLSSPNCDSHPVLRFSGLKKQNSHSERFSRHRSEGHGLDTPVHTDVRQKRIGKHPCPGTPRALGPGTQEPVTSEVHLSAWPATSEFTLRLHF